MMPAPDWTRRDFLARTAAAVPAFLLGTPAAAPHLRPPPATGLEERHFPTPSRDDEVLYRISLAQWSFHRTLNAGEMDTCGFVRTARTDFGIEAVEYVNTFFKEKARDEGYLDGLAAVCRDQGVRSLLIMCDGEGAVGDPDAAARTRAVENHYRWVEAARRLGCHSIRVNARSEGTREEQRKLVADGLARIVEYAEPREINVLVENHGGLSSDGAWLASVMRTVDHPRCGTLPDFGNFRLAEDRWYDRYRGVRELMPFAKAVSAKSHDFDEEGDETGTDYRRMMRIVLESGYRGWVGIEYEGSRLPESEGVRATLALLQRVREELAPEFEPAGAGPVRSLAEKRRP